MFKILGVVLFVAVFILSGSLFVVRQTEQALVLEFGEPVKVVNGIGESDPGLHFKKPFFFQTVRKFDKRILHFDADPKPVSVSGLSVSDGVEEDVSVDKKDVDDEVNVVSEDVNTSRIIVDAYAKYKIIDPLDYYQSGFSDVTFRARLDSILESNLRGVIGGNSLHDLLTNKRREIMDEVKDNINAELQKSTQSNSERKSGSFGVEVVDVRIKRADLVPDNYYRVVNKMKAEFEKAARQFRAEGAEEAQKITAQADKESTVIIANAERDAQITRGAGDAEATKIYAQAFGVDRQFYEFFRSLEAYKKAIKKDDTKLVLSPDGEFLKYFGDIEGKK